MDYPCKEFLGLESNEIKSSNSTVIFDTKATLDCEIVDSRLLYNKIKKHVRK